MLKKKCGGVFALATTAEFLHKYRAVFICALADIPRERLVYHKIIPAFFVDVGKKAALSPVNPEAFRQRHDASKFSINENEYTAQPRAVCGIAASFTL